LGRIVVTSELAILHAETIAPEGKTSDRGLLTWLVGDTEDIKNQLITRKIRRSWKWGDEVFTWVWWPVRIRDVRALKFIRA
jgi:hypothetical protein